MRIALGIEYDGSSFAGWQCQDGTKTVQGCVEAALSKVANHSIRVVAAGRTDAGVHASGQVVHFDTTVMRSDRSWIFGTNTNMPQQISVLWAQQVPDDFHARFSAIRRRYRYLIFCRAVRPTFLAQRVTWDYRNFDVARMAEAAAYLVGEHDFSSYRALACQAKSPIRTVHHLNLEQRGQIIEIDIKANAFLHHMVRNIAGVLMAIGASERDPSWAHQILLAKDRTLGGVTAKPDGLYLTEVHYPERFGLPVSSESPWVG